jgi:hypothetical protein
MNLVDSQQEWRKEIFAYPHERRLGGVFVKYCISIKDWINFELFLFKIIFFMILDCFDLLILKIIFLK